jgi:hypothetical protein
MSPVYRVTRQTKFREHSLGTVVPADSEPEIEMGLARGDIEVIDPRPVRLELERATPPRDWPKKT